MLQPPSGPREAPLPAGLHDDPAEIPPQLAERAGEGVDATSFANSVAHRLIPALARNISCGRVQSTFTFIIC